MQTDFVKLSSFKNIPTNNSQYPTEFIVANHVIILENTEDKVIVGITENTDENVISTIKGFHNLPIEFKYINQVELSSWLGNKLEEESKDSQKEVTDDTSDKNLIDKMANDAPTVNLVNSICIDAIRLNASDIHIEAGITNAKVRYRIDGVLQTVKFIENDRFSAVSSRIKIMANLNILEKRQPQDGRITVSINKENIDFRVSIVPVTGGESIVMRILGKNSVPEQLDLLGFNSKQLSMIRSMMKIPHGLILVTGPTGSGKTTTLNAMMRELVSDQIKIISIEDPVEYIVEGVNQIQINEQINLGFDTILRRVLRQDPNIIMVGEIRDKATAELSVRAALTGHLVLSTLHTNDAVSVIPRLINMGIEPYLIASVLKGAIAQRLVRKINKETQNFQGRTVLSETILMDSGLQEIIEHGANQNKITDYLISQRMEFIKDDAKEKIKLGLTTKNEVEKEILL
ncbi:MAG: type II/IV secretion system protein [Treponema sp.]|nr:type II/IV secretion system protein [Treponema sp.]